MSEKNSIDKILSTLVLKSPLLGYVTLQCQIVLKDDLPSVAATDGRKIMVSPAFFELSTAEQVGVLAHEAAHVVLDHVRRLKGKDAYLANVAADCAANTLLLEAGFSLPEGVITAQYISKLTREKVEEIKKMSAEEIYALLVRSLPSTGGGGDGEDGDGEDGDGEDGEGGEDGAPLPRQGRGSKWGVGGGENDLAPSEDSEREGEGTGREGKETVLSPGSSAPKTPERLRDEAEAFARAVGKFPGGIARIFGKLRRPRVDWRSVIRDVILAGWRTPMRAPLPHRRLPDLLGNRMMGGGAVAVLVDTSGSISEEMLSQFASEVFSIVKTINAVVFIIPWDAEAYGVYRVSSTSEVITVFKEHLQGGGGTVLTPALELLEKEWFKLTPRPGTIVIFSDCLWDDEDAMVDARLQRFVARGSRVVVATTGREPELKHARVVRIEVES
jgi:predicted metal-dependent peptidase